MSERHYSVWAGLFITLALAGFAAFAPLPAMWGINHLLFLPHAMWVVFGAVTFVVILLAAWPRPNTALDSSIDSLSHGLFERGVWPRLAMAAGFTVMFWLLRTPTHFLGDGYTLIASMGKGDSYIIKWTESGTILLIRVVQSLLGDYTRETSLAAFQIVSIMSGAVVVHNLMAIIGRLVSDNRLRLFALIAVIGSGSMLLFCGYAEYYPALWATATTFILLSLRYARTGRGLTWVAASFVLTCLAHLQSLVFLPGLAYLIAQVELRQKWHMQVGRTLTIIAVAGAALAGATFFYMYSTRIEFEAIFLPLFTGRSRSPEYAIFSLKHLLDILNQIILICPLILPVIALAVHNTKKATLDPVHTALALFASGSVLFLFVIDPVIGLGRDWDLMSLTILPPMLFLLYRIGQIKADIPTRVVLASGLVGVLVTGLFLAVNVGAASSESRMHELLRYYGAKNRSGWVILANYHLENGHTDQWREIGKERDSYFPEDQKLVDAYELLARGQYEQVLAISRELITIDPYRGDYYQILGNVWGKLKRYDSAETNYRTAIKLIPYAPMLKNELGQLLLNEGKFSDAVNLFKQVRSFDHSIVVVAEGLALGYYFLGFSDSAAAIADTLFMADRNSPGGHLIYMIVAIRDDDQQAARFHYEQFLLYGKSRSDWSPIKEHYRYLVP
ncbi:MAG: hypothetical protein HY851_10500 [candidate division Zixibacteria bacterium]|nr:hypothetical protein [candidate division Zixibacteria bacterium]